MLLEISKSSTVTITHSVMSCTSTLTSLTMINTSSPITTWPTATACSLLFPSRLRQICPGSHATPALMLVVAAAGCAPTSEVWDIQRSNALQVRHSPATSASVNARKVSRASMASATRTAMNRPTRLRRSAIVPRTTGVAALRSHSPASRRWV